MNYSKAIRVTRALADLSQRELATELGVDPSYVSMLEKGKRDPSRETLEKIAEKLKVPLHLLILIAAERGDATATTGSQFSQLGEALAEVYFANSDRTRTAHRAAPPRKPSPSGTKAEH